MRSLASRAPLPLLRFALPSTLVTLVMLLLPAADARAEPPSSENAAAAEALFQDARKLVADKRYAEACPKFAASQRIAPAVGTLLNLGDCYERLGKTASAWATYLEAASSAQRAGRADREQTARTRAAAVETKLSRLTLQLESTLPGLVVKRDGTPVDEAALGIAVPLDPGTHRVEVSAPGKRTWSSTVEVPPTKHVNVIVPELVDEPAPAPARPANILETGLDVPRPAPPPPAEFWSTQRVIGFGLAGLGVVGLGTGTFFGLKANSSWSDAKSQCDGNLLCNEDGVSSANDAKSAGTISTAAFVVGAVALVTGAVLFFTAPSKRSQARSRGLPTHESAGACQRGREAAASGGPLSCFGHGSF
ncbi:hypothetical protein [Pendulispora albinea]|uniref:PEGA domain-containing protein n=1 Tax=Pendulispora albinea TaxID=2741071 RepID=A0ABZ2LU06_9BACT